jgi:tetratricopeptide (TPR) repeat protein
VSTDLANLVATASLLVGVVSGIYTALSYYAQRRPLTTDQRTLAAATGPWQALLAVAASCLLVTGLLDAATSMPVAWIRAEYGAGVAVTVTAILGRWRAARSCRTQLARQQTEQIAAAEAASKLQRVAVVDKLLAGVDPDGQLPAIGNEALPIYARWVGVARSRYAAVGAAPYIPRPTTDRELDDALGLALDGSERDRLLLVVGPSKAGKTRSALEGLRRHNQLCRAPLLAPRPGSLADLARLDPPLPIGEEPAVLWLDDLERYLTGQGRLTPELLNQLRRIYPKLVTVATIRTDRYQSLMNLPRRGPLSISRAEATSDRPLPVAVVDGDASAIVPTRTSAAVADTTPGGVAATTGGLLANPEARELVEQAQVIHMPLDFASDAERDEATRRYPSEDFRRGPGEQLAAAWEHDTLYRTCPDADPICWAVIQAAIDWRRAGLICPIGEQTLRRLARHYLPAQGPLAFPSPERLGAAIAEAQKLPTESSIKALQQAAEQPEAAYIAFDYLVDCADGRNEAPARPIPDTIWKALATDLAPVEELLALGGTADTRIKDTATVTDVRRAASERLLDADRGDLVAAGHLFAGILLGDQGDVAEAQAALERARAAAHSEVASLAMTNLGWLAEQRGDRQEAERWYRQAAGAGNARAMNNLGWLAEQRGDRQEAERWYRQAAGAGNARAMNNLGWLAEQQEVVSRLVEVRWRSPA